LPEPYLTTARNALFDRLQYIRHFYTCFYEASIEGGTCFDPLFFSYPNLNQTFENITDTFIVAGTFKVSPVLEQNVTTYHSFFPNGNWVSMKNFGDVLRVNNVTGGEMVEMANPTDTVNVHLKPGKIATF
jgi:alpha-glucosidase (family GH31 glycosyl hydrolase)